MCNLLLFALCTVSLVASAVAIDDRWRPPSQPRIYSYGAPSFLRTTGQDSVREYWYDVADRTTFLFGVTSCGSATLYFSEHHGRLSNVSLIVTLGARENTYSRILDGHSLEEYDGYDTPNVLQCSANSFFWAEWKFNYLVIGQGRQIGENVMLTHWTKEQRHVFNAIGLTSSDGQTALWQVRENSGSILHVYSKADQDYGRVWKAVSNRVWMPFKLKGCQEARILLSPNLEETDGNFYEVILMSNKATLRGQTLGKTEELVSHTGEILSCTEYRSFWVSWSRGTVRFGTGVLYGDQVLLYHHDQDPFPVRAIALRTSGDSEEHWRIDDDLETVTTFVTPARSTLITHWYETPVKTFATFSVLACQPLSIALSQKDGLDVDYYFRLDIYIDVDGKRVTSLYSAFSPIPLVTVETPDLLSCTESRDFWLSWKNNVIEFGRGRENGHMVVLPAYDLESTSYIIQSLGFSSPEEGEATWTISESVGEKLRVFTNGAGSVTPLFTANWRTVQVEKHAVFRVMACSNAHIALSDTVGVVLGDPFYEIVIGAAAGDNSTAVTSQLRIREGSEVTAVLQTIYEPDVLSCTSMQDFWVTWHGGLIQVGRGLLPGHNVVMGTRNELKSNIRAISWDTSDDVMGMWEFEEDVGDDIMVITSGAKAYDHYMMIPSYMDFATFKVRACSDAHVLLTTSPNQLESDVIEIILGANGNTETVIHSVSGGVVNKTTGPMLSCEGSRDFWLSWKNGLIEIGQGILVDFSPPLVSYQVPFPLVFTALTFTTAEEQEGIWHWQQRSFLFATFKTAYRAGSTQQVIRTLEHVRNMVFGIQGCVEAKMLFSDQLALKSDNSFALHIGGNRNQETSIEQYNQGALGTRTFRKDTADILSCNENKYFWAAWFRREFQFGIGKIVGENKTLTFNARDGFQVRSVALGTGPGTSYESNTWKLFMLEEWFTPGNRTDPPPTREPTTPTPSPPVKSGHSQSEVAGIVLGVLFALIAIVVVLVIVLERTGKLRMPDTAAMFGHVKFSNDNGGTAKVSGAAVDP